MAGTAPWEPPFDGTEVEHLLGALDRQRATFRWKADGRGRNGLTTTVGASTMTLGGLLKHLALVEDVYSTTKLSGEPLGEPWTSMPGAGEDDLEWTTAADDEPGVPVRAVRRRGRPRAGPRTTRRSRDGGLDQRVALGRDHGITVSLRRLLFDLLEEYGRHTGHADLLSEAVDGRVGEDPPDGWVPVGAVDDGEGHEPAVPHFARRRMLGARFEGVDLTGAAFTRVDLDGATFRGANLRRVTISGSDLVDVTINAGDLRERHDQRRGRRAAGRRRAEPARPRPRRSRTRPTPTGSGAGGRCSSSAGPTPSPAPGRCRPSSCTRRSTGEWSFVETLRHLVFATQSWVGRGILGDPAPWHPLGLPWDEAPDDWDLPRDRDVRPTLDEVLAVRAEHQAMVRRVLEGLTDDQLDTVPEVRARRALAAAGRDRAPVPRRRARRGVRPPPLRRA